MNQRPSALKSRTALQPLPLGAQESSTPEFRALRRIHEGFARSASEVLSSLLQSELLVTVADIELTTLGEFQSSLPKPACLIALRLHPEPERIILSLDASTVLGLLDLFLGGPGEPPPIPRELTEIEWSLLEEISRALLRSLGESWQTIKPVEFVVETLASEASLLPRSDPARSTLRISFSLEVAGQPGRFELAVARSFFEVPQPPEAEPETAKSGPAAVDIERNALLLEDAEVELEVRLEGTRLPFGELLALRQGQVVKFDHGLNEPLHGVVNGDYSLNGHILVTGRKRVFQIEEALPQKR